VFIAQDHNLSWIRTSPKAIGARDPVTFARLEHFGISAEMVGCATTTFDRYRGPRRGTVIVDVNPTVAVPKSADRITHHLCSQMSWREQWSYALEALDMNRTASEVYT